MELKICTTCRKVKPRSEFYRSARQIFHICIPCKREYSRKQKLSPEYSRSRYLKHLDKNRARAKARAAVKSGELQKPLACQNCGHEEKLDAHHKDYSKPLDVEWYCRICHMAVHNKIVDKSLIRSKS